MVQSQFALPQGSALRHESPRSIKTPASDVVGRIMWLPPKRADLGFENGAYDHPVVVVSPETAEGKVDVLVMTSLGGVSVAEKYPSFKRGRLRHLPIKPSPPHPDHAVLLELFNDGDQLDKKTYVKTEKVVPVKLEALRAYRTSPPRPLYLSWKSYRQLVDYIGYAGVTQVSRYGPSATVKPVIPQIPPVYPSARGLPVAHEPSSPRAGPVVYGLLHHHVSMNRLAPLQRVAIYPIPQPQSGFANQGATERTRLFSPGIYHNYHIGATAPLPRSPYYIRDSGHDITNHSCDSCGRCLSWVPWRKVFWIGFLVAMILLGCYCAYLAVMGISDLLLTLWRWLEHHIDATVVAIREWFISWWSWLVSHVGSE